MRLVVKPQVYPQARAGEDAFGDGLGGSGTLGWNLILDGAVVALSNWHVFCPNGNDTPLGLDVFLDGAHEADLSVFQPVRRLGNTWDYALATYTNPALALAQMRACDDGAGTVHPYPMALSDPSTVSVGDGQTYRKVGDRSPRCRTGTLDGVGSFWVDYGAHGQAHFDNQLIFSKMSDPGDSGSVVVRLSDNTVTGLNFAGDDHETDANPLFRAGWSFLGTRRLIEGGPDLPEFSSNPSGLGTDLPVASARPDLEPPAAAWMIGKSATSFRNREWRESSFFTISNLQGLPNFTSGKSILATVARQQDVPAETTEVIDLENGLLLCLGDRMQHGWGIRQAQTTTPGSRRNPPSAHLGGTYDMTYRDPRVSWWHWFDLVDRNDSSALFVMGFASNLQHADTNVTHLSPIGLPNQERPFWGELWVQPTWIVPPPPPTPRAPTVRFLEVMTKHTDTLRHPYLHRNITRYFVCYG